MGPFRIVQYTKTISGKYLDTIIGTLSMDEVNPFIKFLSDGECKGFEMSLSEFIDRLWYQVRPLVRSRVSNPDIRFIYNENLVKSLLFIAMHIEDSNIESYMETLNGCFQYDKPEYSEYSVLIPEPERFRLYGVNAVECTRLDYWLNKKED
jgi:hypothetical protein